MKLNQVLAIEKSVKERATRLVTDLYHSVQKPELFAGFVKRWRKTNEQGEVFPDESKRVQLRVDDVMRQAVAAQIELADIAATKDFANMSATADIVLNGVVLVEKAPATFIMWAEKQLEGMRTFVGALPVLDEADEWNYDDTSSLYKTPLQSTHRTAKIQVPIVLYDATPEHPAQTQLISKDEIIGFWDSVKQSGAVPRARKQILMSRVESLYRAVREAREAANIIDVDKQNVGTSLFGFILAD